MTELRARRPEEGWLTLALVVVMMVVLASAIDDPAYVNGRGNLTDGLVWFALAGVAFGFIGPKLGWSRWTTHGVGALFGGLLIPIVAGMAIAPGSSIGGAFDASAQGIVQAYFDTVWLSQQYTTVQVHYIIAFGAIVWAAGQFTAYAVFGHRRPLNAVIMAGIVLLANMSITFGQLPYLVVFTGASLFLLIEMHAFDERATWIRRRIGDPGTISSLYLRGGTVFIFAAMFGSLLLTNRAASSPLAGAWRPVHDQLVEVGETIGRILPVGGNLRGGGVTFGPIAKIGAQWFNNDDPVFSAVVPANVPKDVPLYWRAVTLNQFALGAWVNTAGATNGVDAGAPLLDGTEEAPDPDLTVPIKVTVRPDNFAGTSLLTPGLPTDVTAGAVVNLTGPDGWFQGADIQGDPSEYTVNAEVMQEGDTAVISGNRLAAASTAYPTDVTDLYTDVPKGAIGPEAQKLLDTVIKKAGGSTNPYVLAKAMEDYLHSDVFHYSTNLTNLPNNDPECGRVLRDHQDGVLPAFRRRRWRSCCGRRTRRTQSRPGSSRASSRRPRSGASSRSRLAPRMRGSRSTSLGMAGSGSIPPAARPASRRARSSPDRASRRRPRRQSTPKTAAAIRSAARRSTWATTFRRRPLPRPRSATARCSRSSQSSSRCWSAASPFAAWLRGPRGEINPDRAWQSMAKAAGRFGFAPRPNQTIYEYATSLGELVPVARADLATVADAKVETAYARVRLGGDRMTEVGAAARRLRITLLRLVFMRRGRRKRRP